MVKMVKIFEMEELAHVRVVSTILTEDPPIHFCREWCTSSVNRRKTRRENSEKDSKKSSRKNTTRERNNNSSSDTRVAVRARG